MSANNGRAVVSWSGGKDSCLACYLALQQGWQVAYLLNMISQEFMRSGGHGVDYRLMQEQGRAMGIPMHQSQYGRDNYEQVFKAALAELREREGVTALITGDIYLQEHRDWVERVAAEAGLKPVFPLWGMEPLTVTQEFLRLRFQSLVVALQAELMGEEWLGRWLNDAFVHELLAEGKVDPAGERGEFHTFVVDGPLFHRRIDITEVGKVLRDKRWFLDIVRYEVKDKQ